MESWQHTEADSGNRQLPAVVDRRSPAVVVGGVLQSDRRVRSGTSHC
jgi:hypothetical protein